MTILTLCTKFKAARKELINEINDIRADDITSFYELPEFTQRKLAGLLLRALDVSNYYEWLTDNSELQDFIISFSAALISDRADDYDTVREELCDMVLEWHSEHLNELISEGCPAA